MEADDVEMAPVETTIVNEIEMLRARRGATTGPVSAESKLYDDLGLDSLELAELSAMLEQEFGRDPFSEGIVPETVGELISFYGD